MVYGLQVILPMEFLILTLRVANELSWIGNELANQLKELEELDETCLAPIHGMYALKRRQKKFHDIHINTKEFKLGDLVLLFTLKQFISKFTKRRQCLYVISGLSSNSAVRLSTLDGEEMANWISGCMIKKYNLPLTTLKD